MVGEPVVVAGCPPELRQQFEPRHPCWMQLDDRSGNSLCFDRVAVRFQRLRKAKPCEDIVGLRGQGGPIMVTRRVPGLQ